MIGTKRALYLAGAAGAWIFVGACMTYDEEKLTPADNGLTFSHKLHADLELGIACSDCHQMDDSPTAVPAIPNHELCGLCHDIIGDASDISTCRLCHTRDDQLVDDRPKILSQEMKFVHVPHVNAEVACETCHVAPDQVRLIAGGLKPFCMDCHEEVRPEINECSVCHNRLSRETRPEFRWGVRIAHDVPELWERAHGHEAQIDPAYCALCHTNKNFCEECHSKHAPTNHTISWRRKTHGFHGAWDRDACATCHEEQFCVKCHTNTRPASHRGSWDSPLNGHCTSCHFPPQNTNCTVCHERINHPSAAVSPHTLGIFPPNCALCHPGGLPRRAPHLQNSTVRCTVCHR